MIYITLALCGLFHHKSLFQFEFLIKAIFQQARYQEFLRAGEVSENKGTSINI